MITWEYVAGFLDGDGSISVDVRSGDGESQGYKTRLSIAQGDNKE